MAGSDGHLCSVEIDEVFVDEQLLFGGDAMSVVSLEFSPQPYNALALISA